MREGLRRTWNKDVKQIQEIRSKLFGELLTLSPFLLFILNLAINVNRRLGINSLSTPYMSMPSE